MFQEDLVQPAAEVGSAIAQLRDLPWGAHALAAGALATGLILWLIGRRVLKPMVVVLFLLLGSAVGFVALPMTGLAGSVSVYVGMLVGAAVGALMGVLLYKFAMAVGLGLVLGVAAPLTAAAVMSFTADHYAPRTTPPPATAPGAPEEDALTREPDGDADWDRLPAELTEEVIRRQIDNLRRQLKGEDPVEDASPAEAAPDEKAADVRALEDVMRTGAERVRAFGEAVAKDVAVGWGQLTPRLRLILTGSAGVGLALGIILGVVLPGWSAGLVTALLGAGVWLAAGSWLALAVGAPGSEHLQRPAREWLVIWLIVAALGVAAQWIGLVRSKRRKKGKDAE